jgi:TetR/AcrR family transcriptional repressor of nem operon
MSKESARVSNKDKLLKHGLQVMRERGFVGASVRDIVKAAGVPQGSFTNHFASKEAFALEVLNIYAGQFGQIIERTLYNSSLSPESRFERYTDEIIASLSHCGIENGCLLGNFSIEASEHSELLRQRLVEIFAQNRQALSMTLKAVADEKRFPENMDFDLLASLIMSTFQGAILLNKTEQKSFPFNDFKRMMMALIRNQGLYGLHGV